MKTKIPGTQSRMTSKEKITDYRHQKGIRHVYLTCQCFYTGKFQGKPKGDSHCQSWYRIQVTNWPAEVTGGN